MKTCSKSQITRRLSRRLFPEETPLTLGPWLALDSDNERFIDSPAANTMLTRDCCKPFVVPEENEI